VTTPAQRAAGLGLPLREPVVAWTAATAVFALYLATMARDLTFYDSPELALVAHQLGVGHPIGMPLHTLIGWGFARLGDPVFMLTLMSALFGALCVIPAWSLADRLVEARRPDAWLRAAAFVGIGASVVAWEPSTRVEVYTLAVFCALWGCARAAVAPGFAAGLALGLGFCAHAVIAVAHALGVAPRVVSRSVEGDDAPGGAGALGRFVAGGVVGLLPYAYLPLAAADPARFAWGAPRDAASMLAYVGGGDYRHNQGIELGDWLSHLGELALWGAENGVLPLIVVGAIGFFALGRARGQLGWLVVVAPALCVAFVAANVVFHPDVPDYRGYYLGPLWLAGAGLAAASQHAFRSGGRRARLAAGLALVPALALFASSGHLGGVRDHPSLARLLATSALEEAPSGAILVVAADHHVAPLLYLQEVEGARPDVTVVAMGLASSSWYWDHLAARHPDLEQFALTAPGDGRAARVRRLLAANPERRVLTESSELAFELGRMPCGVGALIWTARPGESGCRAPDPAPVTQAIAAAAPFRAESLEVAARVGEARGVALWRLGLGAPALDAMTSGLHASGVGPAPVEEVPPRAAPLSGALPAWTRPAALHDPARNVALAGLLLDAAGRRQPALAYVDAAIAMGLTDARIARTQILGRQ